MSEAANNLSKEKLQQLLSAIGSGPQEDSSGIETSEYNWNQPRFFDRRQLNRLDAYLKRVARGISLKLADYFQIAFDVKVVSMTQHFASELDSQVIKSEQDEYYMAFGREQDYCGLISIPAQTASVWAMKLLGDSESEALDTERDLSHLEESLVCDLLSAFLVSFTQDYLDFHPAKHVVKRLFPLELRGSEELCKITFNIKKLNLEEGEKKEDDREKSDQAYILIQSSELIPLVGKSEHVDTGFSAKEVSKAILANMSQMPVFVTAQLASVILTLKDIMSLEEGDVLLLGKRVNEPIELVTCGRTVLLGRPAKSAGKYAVVITEFANDKG